MLFFAVSFGKIVLHAHKIVADKRIRVHVVHTAEDIYVHVGIALPERFYKVFHLPALGKRIVVLGAGGKTARAVKKFQLMPLAPRYYILLVHIV